MNWEQLIQTFGYPLVALGIGLESMGIPAPGETILVVGAAFAANGRLNIFWVILSAAAGAIIGDNIAFLLGRRHGRTVLSRIAHLDEARLARSEAFFARHGPKTVFLARFIPLLRMIAAYLAGINKMPAATFAFYNMAGGLSWAIVMGGVGYFFGQNLPLIEAWMRRIGAVIAVIILLGGFLFWLNYRWRRSEQAFRAGKVGRLFSLFQQGWQGVIQQGQRGLALYGLSLLVAGWLVGELIDGWLDREPGLYQLDRALTPWLRSGVTEAPLWLEGLAGLGDLRWLGGLALVAAGWQLWRGTGRVAGLTMLNFLGALALGWSLQLWLKRPLPLTFEPAWPLTGYAFPHLPSMVSLVMYTWLAYLWGRRRKWASRVNAGTIAGFVILSQSITGLYLGQAHLSDVLAGLLLGTLWLAIPIGLWSLRK